MSFLDENGLSHYNDLIESKLTGKVSDVTVNGTSVVSNGTAEIPMASANGLGVVKINASNGINIGSTGNIYVLQSSSAQTKEGTNDYRPITPTHQHESVFYGLTKAAGVDMANSENAVGTYTSEAKSAIQTMLGVPGDVQVNGTSVVSNGVANIPVATSNAYGAVLIGNGLQISSTNGTLMTRPANLSTIKPGSESFMQITPNTQHISTFYGLAKAAGDSTQSASENAVGTYTSGAKSAIQTMLNVPDASDVVSDVTINGTSVVSDGVAEIPLATKAPVIIDTASGTIASFEDGADSMPLRSLTVNVEPVQDLHGYENPWPAGGGVNKLDTTPDAVKPLNTDGTWNGNAYTQNGVTFTVSDDGTITVNGTSTNTVYFYLGDFTTGENAFVLNGYQGSYMNLLTLVGIDGSTWYTVKNSNGVEIPANTTASIRLYCATGANASNAVFKPMIRLSSVTDATFAPYSNICPISGWTEANITRTGKNLFHVTAETQTFKNVIYTVNNDGSVELSGSAPNGISAIRLGSITLKGGVSYILSGSIDASKYLVVEGRGNMKDFGSGVNITFENDTTVNIQAVVLPNVVPSATLHPMIHLASDTDPTFEPFVASGTIPITFPSEAGTVYGGTLDVTSGVLTATMAYQDLGALTWSGSDNVFSTSLTTKSSAEGKCSIFKVIPTQSFVTAPYDTIQMRGSSVYVKCSTTYANSGDFTAAMSGVQLVYELATLQTYQLTPTEVDTLLGENNIWANTGDSTVTYIADSKLYIDQHHPEVPVTDVQINGTSILNQGVAEIPVASGASFGVVKLLQVFGIRINGDGQLYINKATTSDIKTGTSQYLPIVPSNNHESAFYGLAKAAGDTTQSSSSNAVGTYTDTAKAAIKNMLGVSGESQTITVTGTTPTITAQPNTRYICGEVLSLDFTPCVSGICNVTFTSGSTVTVLSLPQTVKMPEWFEVETNTTYEISIMDGVYGAVMSWAI